MTMGTTHPSIYSKEPLRSYVDTAFVNHDKIGMVGPTEMLSKMNCSDAEASPGESGSAENADRGRRGAVRDRSVRGARKRTT